MQLSDRDARAIYTTTEPTYRCQPVQALKDFLATQGYTEEVCLSRPAVYEYQYTGGELETIEVPHIPEVAHYEEDENGEEIRVVDKPAVPRLVTRPTPRKQVRICVDPGYVPPVFSITYDPPKPAPQMERELSLAEMEAIRSRYNSSSITANQLCVEFKVSIGTIHSVLAA